MKEKELKKYIDDLEKVSARNYYNYQETGIARYDRAYHKADMQIEIARQALSAADDHAAVGRMHAELTQLCSRAINLLHCRGDIIDFLKDMRAIGKLYGVKDPWEGSDG